MRNEESGPESKIPLSVVDPIPSSVDYNILSQVIFEAQNVSHNLGTMVSHSDKIIRRQNFVIFLCTTALASLIGLFVIMYSTMKTQELIHRQMEIIKLHLEDIKASRGEIGHEILELEKVIEAYGQALGKEKIREGE